MKFAEPTAEKLWGVILMTDVRPGTERAGGSVRARYDQDLKAWQHRIRPFTWPTVAVGAACLVAGTLITSHRMTWFLATVGASLVTLVICLRNTPPDEVTDLLWGAEGEERTAKQLASLGPGWTIRHDLQARFGNIDHLVSSPAGVFIIDSKNWAGTTTITPRGVLRESKHNAWRRSESDRLVRSIKGCSAGTSESLARLAGLKPKPWVTPVIAIWGEFPQGMVQHHGVWFVAGERLAEWLRAQPPKLNDQRLSALSRVL